MPITLTPQLNLAKKVTFRSENMNVTESNIDKKKKIREQTKQQQKKSTGVRGIAAGISYAWINLTEGIKGLFKGAWYGFIAGTLTAGISAHFSAKNRIKKGEKIGLIERFKPKHMTKTTKILSWVVAGAVLVWNLILAKMRANQKTANVDHALYTGHRAE